MSREKERAEKFAKILDRILAGEKVDLSKYPSDLRGLAKFAERLTASQIRPDNSFKNQLKKRLLARLEKEEFGQEQGFWERLKRIGHKPVWQALAATVVLILLVGGAVWGFGVFKPEEDTFQQADLGLKKFVSAKEFKDYLVEASALADVSSRANVESMRRLAAPRALEEQAGVSEPEGALPGRISETTVQVKGVDEPDIVKTDGKEVYFSASPIWKILQPQIEESQPSIEGRMISPPQEVPPVETEAKTSIIKAFPPQALALDSKIDKTGDLLLHQDMLVVFSGQEIGGYNVSNPKSPEKKWNIKLEETTSMVASRLYKDKIYIVTQTSINLTEPSPIKILTLNNVPLNIGYKEIYHPTVIVPVDSTFSVLVVDPTSGATEKKTSFIGSAGNSVVYMSENAIYVTYSYYKSPIEFIPAFLKEDARDLAPDWLIEKVEKLESLDISKQAKVVEFQNLWNRYLNSLNEKDRVRVEGEFSRRMSDYHRKHMRDLEKTGVVKVGLEGILVKATGSVPGYPLNQFALDEYKGYLRIATTVGERGAIGREMLIPLGSDQSANDVYVLDKDLNVRGSIKDLGLTERIFSARFIEDKGYLVTFREIDPLYVLNLSDPEKPKLEGELKIPGYSSYLQPITKDKILGIGKEGSRVKASLFDVSNPNNPKELAKYIFEESWSDVLETHRAFLLDEKHEIFFLPGSKAGYIVSYKNDKLELKKAVEGLSVRRAIFLDDYLYIIGDGQITVLDEKEWGKINELRF